MTVEMMTTTMTTMIDNYNIKFTIEHDGNGTMYVKNNDNDESW